MKKFATIVVAVVVSIGVIGSTASADKGRRIAGPICVNLDTGVVRAVAEIPFQACRTGEIRRYGLKVQSKTIIIKGKAGPKGATGKAGGNGAPGSAGVAGPSGPAGLQGPAGPAGATGAAGAKGEAGAKGDTGSAGPKGETGAQGSTGATGVTGATGAAGPKGDKGDAGTGLGDGYRWICKQGQGNGSLHDGGTGANPDCNNGAGLAFKVVTIGATISNP